jgi:hypothetical protein
MKTPAQGLYGDLPMEKFAEKMASLFFETISRIEPPGSGYFLFDTTNYYTFMASDTDSAFAKRGV